MCAGSRVGVPARVLRDGHAAGGRGGCSRRPSTSWRRWASQVEEISLPHTEYGLPVYYLIAPAEASANLARYDGVRYGYRARGRGDMWDAFRQTRGAGFRRRGQAADHAGHLRAVGRLLRRLLSEGAEGPHADQARFRPGLQARRCDPGAYVAFGRVRIGEQVDDPLQMYLSDIFTLTLNLAGMGGLSVPCGFADGLPIGLQIVGPALAEARILRVGYAYEQATDWHLRQPTL